MTTLEYDEHTPATAPAAPGGLVILILALVAWVPFLTAGWMLFH